MMLICCDSGHGRLYSIVIDTLSFAMGEPCLKSLNPNCASCLFKTKGNSSCGSHVKREVIVYGLKDGLQLHVED